MTEAEKFTKARAFLRQKIDDRGINYIQESANDLVEFADMMNADLRAALISVHQCGSVPGCIHCKRIAAAALTNSTDSNERAKSP